MRRQEVVHFCFLRWDSLLHYKFHGRALVLVTSTVVELQLEDSEVLKLGYLRTSKI